MDDNTRKALRDLWVAGTAGAILTALARNLPLLQEAGLPPTFPEVLDELLRIAYTVFLLAYFFVSNVDNSDETPDWCDILFDVVQSAATLWALFWIGFALPGHGHGSNAPGLAMRSTGIAIAAIAFSSLVIHGWTSKGKLNGSRFAALVLSLIMFGATYACIPIITMLYVAAGVWVLLCLVLWWFIAVRKA